MTQGKCDGGGKLDRLIATLALVLFLAPAGFAQVVGAAHFELSKRVYLVGEPVFCHYLIRNAGAVTFSFPHRAPTRALGQGLASEPRFVLTDASGRRLPDPAPEPCGGREGTVLYGTVTLPPGQTSVEHWLLNQWGRITRPGEYHVRAQRHLPLFAFRAATQDFAPQPSAYAESMDDLSFKVVPGSAADLEKAYAPLVAILSRPGDPEFGDAVIAITTVPHPFLEEKLTALAGRQSEKYPWVREPALQGLARLNTPQAWNAILQVATGKSGNGGESEENLALRSSAVLMLAEKGDPGFLPGLLELLKTGPASLQQDVLRALGFFHDLRANQALFEHLHSSRKDDRMNAILGLKNLNTKNAFPALLAMLNDPDEQVRQVANFALQALTGQHFRLATNASRAQLARTETEWQNWWQAQNAAFNPPPQAPCRDW